MRTLFEQARILTADEDVAVGWLLIDEGRVAASGAGAAPDLAGAERRDLTGMTVVPGFLDLHVHGGGGAAFDDGAESLDAALAVHRAHGTTRSLISLVANPIEQLVRNLRDIAELAARDPLVLGAHLEGPFLAPERSGAHDPGQLRAPDAATVETLIEAGGGALRQITIAPELPGALDAIERFTAAGVIVAVGHTEANDATVRAAFDRGARLVTHAWNAMPGISSRAPGPLGASFARILSASDARPGPVLELIADGVHVDPEVIRLTFASAPGHIALVTDAMAAAGHADGRYLLGSLEVEVADGIARVAATGALAGSTLTLDRALQVVLASGVSPMAAIGALTETPAAVLGLSDDLGDFREESAADLVVLDADGMVREVWAVGTPLSPSDV